MTRLLISADALWENGFGVVFPELEGLEAFTTVRATLDAFARLRVRIVIPGHGPPFKDFHAALTRAHARLDGFMRDPKKHAIHAAKVLIKFRLLETQSETYSEFERWLKNTTYFDLVRQRHFAEVDTLSWRRSIIEDMKRRGSLGMAADGRIFNVV